MATISELNVRLGLLYKDFDKSLGQVEKRLERSGRKFSQLGNDLTLAVTAPLVALGAAAIQQAGEIESLKLAMVSTFETAGRSAEEANKEVEALRKSALAPGLDFEQAIKGSIRLQGVGYAAEDARKTIEQVANAIALTGGTAQNLDSVTVQFAQIISKGKVLSQDLRIIQENMPIISRLMKEAFGTQNAEALQNMGISGKEFVDKITEAAKGLPVVEGGIKNALVNAGAAARQSLAKLGESINKAFNIPKTLDTLVVKLQGVVAWFDSLDDSTKKTIIEVGLFAVAAGPVVKVLGAIYGSLGQAVGGFKLLVNASKPVALVFTSLTENTKMSGKVIVESLFSVGQAALKMRVAIIAATGGIAAIILGIAAAIYLMADNFDAAEFTAKKFADAQGEVTQEAAKEVGQLNKNLDILRDVRSGTDDRRKAINDLLAAYPTYFKGMDLEHASLERLNAIQKELTGNVVRGIAERKKADAINAIYEKQADILLRIEQLKSGSKVKESEGALINTGDLLSAGGDFATAVIKKLQQQLKDLSKSSVTTAKEFDRAFGLVAQDVNLDPKLNEYYRAREAADDARDSFLGFGDAAASTKTKLGGAASATGDAADKAQKMADAYKKAVASIEAVSSKADILGSEVLGEKAKEVENQVERLVEMGFGPNSKPIQNLKKYLADIRAEISKGFGTANVTQANPKVNANPAAAPSIATLATSTSVQSIEVSGAEKAIEQTKAFADSLKLAQAAYESLSNSLSSSSGVVQIQAVFAELKNGAITFGEAITASAQIFEEKYGQVTQSVLGKVNEIASGILEIQANRASQEKAQLDEEYAAKLEAAQGNADATKKINEELAAKKAEIDKRVGKTQQKVAIIQAIINTALGVTQALGSAAPPVNFILAALTAAAGAVQIASIKSQKFAEGGVVTKPTLGLVGEYAGAASNPEIISPEKKMRQAFRDEMMGYTGGPQELYSRISGDDLLLVTDRAKSRRGRVGING